MGEWTSNDNRVSGGVRPRESTKVTVEMTTSTSPFAPLRQPWFRWLWPAVLVTYLGLWMQTVPVQPTRLASRAARVPFANSGLLVLDGWVAAS